MHPGSRMESRQARPPDDEAWFVDRDGREPRPLHSRGRDRWGGGRGQRLRLQLTGSEKSAAAAAFAVVMTSTSSARGEDIDGAMTIEIAGYADTVSTNVLTPSVSVSVALPDRDLELRAAYLVDVVSTASPDIVATASPRWEEVRHGASIGFRYKPDALAIGATATLSSTPDYLSVGAAVTGSYESRDKMSTFFATPSYYRDVIGRDGTPFDVFSRTVDKFGLSAGLTRVLDERAFVSVVADMSYEDGDSSKPYRYVPMFTTEAAAQLSDGAGVTEIATLRSEARPLEQLPTHRGRGSLSARFGVRLSPVTIRVDQRLYADSWRLLATTTDLRVPWDVHPRLRIWPHLRLHAQSGVSFWERAYIADGTSVPALRTGDRELGPLVNAGVGAGARIALSDDWALSASGLGTFTRFLDALLVTDKFSGLVSVVVEAAW